MAELKKYKRKYSDEDLERARVLYFEHEPLTVISRIVGIPRASLQHYEKKYWKEDRVTRDNELLSAMTGKKRAHLSHITDNTLKVMARALDSLHTRKDAPTTKEALDAAKILEIMGKLASLPNDVKEEEEEYIDVSDINNIDPFKSEVIEGEVSDEEVN